MCKHGVYWNMYASFIHCIRTLYYRYCYAPVSEKETTHYFLYILCGARGSNVSEKTLLQGFSL